MGLCNEYGNCASGDCGNCKKTVSYRDTLHLLPLDHFVPGITHAEMMEQVDDEIQAVGFIHGHKSHDSVEFQVDADDLWELRERMDDLKLSVLPFAELDIRRECVYETQSDWIIGKRGLQRTTYETP